MAHFVTAIVAAEPIEIETAASYDLPVFPRNGFVVIALDRYHLDYWAEQFKLDQTSSSSIELDSEIVHHFAGLIGLTHYALVNTEYFGGHGTQFAATWKDGCCEMPVSEGAINLALRKIGVQRTQDMDEFEQVGLHLHRSFGKLFKKYAPGLQDG